MSKICCSFIAFLNTASQILAHRFIFILLISAFPYSAFALDVGISHAVYATPDDGYLEINLEIAAASVTFKAIDSVRLQAGVEVLILIQQGSTIVNYEKYVLHSLKTNLPIDLLDVKRLALLPGEYTLDIRVTDIHDDTNKSTYQAQIAVPKDTGIRLSDVQLLRSFKPDQSDHPFTKNGYFLEPLPFNFYDQEAKKLAFYAEVYHSDKAFTSAGTYMARYFIERDLGNGNWTLISVGSQQKKASPIDAILVQMDISQVENGNYRLNVELRDQNQKLVCDRKVTFVRSNPLLHIDANAIDEKLLQNQFVKDLDYETLHYCLKAMLPLCSADESESIVTAVKAKDAQKMRFIVFKYIVKADANNPESAYLHFLDIANAAHVKFKSGFRNGFETDRGRTYMKYGIPDDLIHIEDDPSAPPYEIWVYYNFPKTQQRNVKFLFYNPSLAGEDYLMLHSTARGEINNPRWERELYKKTASQEYDGDNFHDATAMKRNIARNARTYFEDF